jgi:iron complex transport system substrate-binding protein
MPTLLDRRGFLGGIAGVLGLAACSSGSAPSSAGGWSWTDDRGVRVKLATRPTRIAFLTDTAGAALWAAGLHPVAATNSGQGIVTAVGMPKTGITQIYSADDGVNLEALAAARPDLLVDSVQADGMLQVQSANSKVSQIAPVAGVNVYNPVQQIAGTADTLTRAVGRTLDDTAAKARYTAASARLKSAVAANPKLRVGFVFDIDSSTIGVMNPATWPVLKTVKELGLELVTVPSGASNTYSYPVSWEEVPSLPVDFLVWAVSDPLPANPLWKEVPGVHDGQYWKPDIASWYAYTWANFASLLDGLATHVAAAKAGVGPSGELAS